MGDDEKTLAAARDELRSYHEHQQAALANFFALAARAHKLRANLSAVETEQRRALGQLVRSTDAKTAARLTSTSLRLARDALAEHRAESSSGAGNETAG